MANGINWDEMLSSKFIKLTNGQTKSLVLTEWKEQAEFKKDDGTVKPGIIFNVLREDGKEIPQTEDEKKSYTVTAIKAMVQLRPILEKAEAAGKTAISVSIVRVGEGRKTQYSIIDLDALPPMPAPAPVPPAQVPPTPPAA